MKTIEWGLHWNLTKHMYEGLNKLPEGVVLYDGEMMMITACANCGRLFPLGVSFPSKEWYTPNDVRGLPVCETCHKEEQKLITKYG